MNCEYQINQFAHAGDRLAFQPFGTHTPAWAFRLSREANMYGKIFGKMYLGSMVGSGTTVFAVWGYCIATADPESHEVMLNPVLLATTIGTTVDDIEKAITFLSSPDAKSTNTAHDGRRLLHQSGLSYLVVSHEHYRNIKNMSDSREYERLRKKEYRDKKECPKCPGQDGTPAYVSASASGIQKGIAKGEQTDEEWLAELKTKFASLGVNVDEQRIKAEAWISAKPNRQFTRRFFANWLSRCETKINTTLKPAGNNSPLDIKAFAERL